MRDVNAMVMRRSMILWVGTALLLGLNLFAASQGSLQLTMWALALTGAFSVFGIAFGIWAARKVTAHP